jgi:hypothetical protein
MIWLTFIQETSNSNTSYRNAELAFPIECFYWIYLPVVFISVLFHFSSAFPTQLIRLWHQLAFHSSLAPNIVTSSQIKKILLILGWFVETCCFIFLSCLYSFHFIALHEFKMKVLLCTLCAGPTMLFRSETSIFLRWRMNNWSFMREGHQNGSQSAAWWPCIGFYTKLFPFGFL